MVNKMKLKKKIIGIILSVTMVASMGMGVHAASFVYPGTVLD